MMSLLRTYLASCLIISIYGFGGNEDRFIKKYAMMKIYESCFGNEVIKQIRNEMKAASAKCASYNAPPKPNYYPHLIKPIPSLPPKVDEGIMDPDNTIYANAQAQIDVDKINQAILGYRPQRFPYPNVVPTPYRPYQAQVPGIYPGYPGPASMYLPHLYQQFIPYTSQSPFSLPFLGQQYYNGQQRTARHIDGIRYQMEQLTNRMSGRARNVTCIMQQLGYLDENFEPNYAKISERVSRLPIQEELRGDIQEGMTFCQQFAQCVPEVNKEKSPLSKELFRPMFFFKCYKYKKIEACIMKDVREKYSGFHDDDFDASDIDVQRSGKSTNLDKDDDLANTVYEYLYGSDEIGDLDFF